MKRISTLAVLGFGLASLCAAQNQSEKRTLLESKPGAELQARVERLYAEASSISIKYSRLEEVEWAYLSKAQVENHWQSVLKHNCVHRCSGAFPQLQQRLTSGRKIAGACPEPFFVVVEFEQGGKPIGKVFVNGTGQCFSIDDTSYFINKEMSFLSLMTRIFEPLD